MILANITSVIRAGLIADVYSDHVTKRTRVLDAGCGNGVVSAYLADKLQLEIVGTDVSNYLKKGIKFVQMKDKSRLPFGNRTFSAVMFNDTLHHTSYTNQVNLLKEAKRVGKKILIFEVLPTLGGKLADRLINFIHNPYMEVPLTFRTESGWKKLFSKLKLKIKVVLVKRPLLYPFSHIAFILD